MCYPFAEARLRVHRLYKSLAEYFCSSGYDVIRFDYWGQGDSDGEFVESSIETMGKDTNFIISYFRKAFSLNKIIIFGLRLGANIAMKVSENINDLSLILYEPIVDINNYINQVLRLNLLTQMRIYGKSIKASKVLLEEWQSGSSLNIEGFDISTKTYEQFHLLDLYKSKINVKKILYISSVISDNVKKINQKTNKLIFKFEKAECDVTYCFVTAPKFWTEINLYVQDSSFMHEALEPFLRKNGTGSVE